MAAHAHGAEGIKAAVLAGGASTEDGSMINRDIIRLMKKNGTYLVPTTGLLDTIELEGLEREVQAKANYILPLSSDNLHDAIKAGALIALGTDAPLVPHGNNAYEFEAMVNRGMTPAPRVRSLFTAWSLRVIALLWRQNLLESMCQVSATTTFTTCC